GTWMARVVNPRLRSLFMRSSVASGPSLGVAGPEIVHQHREPVHELVREPSHQLLVLRRGWAHGRGLQGLARLQPDGTPEGEALRAALAPHVLTAPRGHRQDGDPGPDRQADGSG